jgi:ATP-binding protein involved in chromosome partitioning
MELTKEKILEALANVIEPDLKKSVVELNLVQNIVIDGKRVTLEVQTANPAMHGRKRMEEACEFALERVLGADIECEVKAVPIESSGENASLRKVLPGVKNIVAVASGKGGVGKSTIAANLAVGLVQQGYSVGMIDADLYGPSVPTMFDLVNAKPKIVEINGKQYIEPIESYGVKTLSIGFFADTNQPIVWRGAMATKALNQLLNDAWWGDLDYMVIDLPPGTGDVHLSIVQALPLTGAVIVSTPQEVALADARKGIAMFQMPNINVPVLGLVENMAWFTPEELPDNKYYIFGKDGAVELAEKLGVPCLAQIPIVQSIRESGDVGRPAVLQENTPSSKAFTEFIGKFVEQVEKRNASLPPTETVKITVQ